MPEPFPRDDRTTPPGDLRDLLRNDQPAIDAGQSRDIATLRQRSWLGIVIAVASFLLALAACMVILRQPMIKSPQPPAVSSQPAPVAPTVVTCPSAPCPSVTCPSVTCPTVICPSRHARRTP